MAQVKAENFNDYIEESLVYNLEFQEDVENAIQEVMPGGKSTVSLDLETKVRAYNGNDKQVDIELSWSGEFEESELTIYGTVKVRADFTGRGHEHALLRFKEILEYTDDFNGQ